MGDLGPEMTHNFLPPITTLRMMPSDPNLLSRSSQYKKDRYLRSENFV